VRARERARARARGKQARRKARVAATGGRSFIVVVLKPCCEERKTTFIGWLLNVQVILLDYKTRGLSTGILQYFCPSVLSILVNKRNREHRRRAGGGEQ
jgi:hypothetical protein